MHQWCSPANPEIYPCTIIPLLEVPTLKLPFYRQLYFSGGTGHCPEGLARAILSLPTARRSSLWAMPIKLVKMIIAPVIFLTIVTGIAGMSQLSTVGRVFCKAMAYFLFFSTLALVVGLVVANVRSPARA